MNIAITQLAFNSGSELLDSSNFFEKNNIQNIELVFSKIDDENQLIEWMNSRGISSKTTQSILFGSSVEDFLDEHMIEQIKKVANLSQKFGVKTLVLGSPKQRKTYDRSSLIFRFREIDSIMREYNQVLCIEPNCKKYGGSYFFTVSEIVEFLKDGKFTNIKTMIDTHNIINENEDPSKVLENNLEYIHHIHISENDLSTYEESEYHKSLSSSIKKTKYDKTITYEVLPSKDLEKSFQSLNKTYQ